MDDQAIIDAILRREGGFVDQVADRGGPTNRGVTLQTLSDFLGRSATVRELRALTEERARTVYAELYVRRPGFHAVRNGPLRGLVVDCAVNHGTRRAAKWLQKVLGVRRDAVIGAKTLAALAAADPWDVYLKLLGHRMRIYGRIVSRDPELAKARLQFPRLQAIFAAGWFSRAAEFVEAPALLEAAGVGEPIRARGRPRGTSGRRRPVRRRR